MTVTVSDDAAERVTVNGIGVVAHPPFPSMTLAFAIEKLGLGVTVIVNVCGALVSTPPFAVPPLSCSCTVTVADPVAPDASV